MRARHEANTSDCLLFTAFLIEANAHSGRFQPTNLVSSETTALPCGRRTTQKQSDLLDRQVISDLSKRHTQSR